MKTAKAATYFGFGLLGATALLIPSRAAAQAAPGPLPPPQSAPQGQIQQQQQYTPPPPRPKPPEAPPRTTLAGMWKFNHDQSDDPRQRVRAAEGGGNYGPNQGGGYPPGGGGYPGGGYPGGGYGYPRGPYGNPGGYPGGGYPGGPQQRYGGQDIENNPKMQPLLRPADSLALNFKDPEIDVTQDQSTKLILYTDGRQIGKQTDPLRVEMAAHWDGSRLVTDEKSPLGGKMDRIFELSSDGRQLFETLDIDNGRSGTPIRIRYVYDIPIPGAQSSTPEDSDPSRPKLMRRSSDDSSSSSSPSGDSDPDRPTIRRRASSSDDNSGSSSPSQ